MLDIKLILNSLEALSSKEYQDHFWMGKDPDVVAFFEEEISLLFDSARLEDAIDKGFLANNFSEILNEKVAELKNAIRRVPDLETQAQINSPEMEKVRFLSSEVLAQFKAALN